MKHEAPKDKTRLTDTWQTPILLSQISKIKINPTSIIVK